MSLISYPFNCLGKELSFNAPATAEEIDRIVGKPGACANAFMLNAYAYQDRNPTLREAVAKAIEEETGVARGAEQAKNAKGELRVDENGKPIMRFTESEQTYVNRVMAATADAPAALSEERFSEILIEQNELIGDWQPSEGGRDSKPKKEFYDLADVALGHIKADRTTNERLSANIGAKLGVAFESAFGEVNRDNLARAFKAIDAKAKREAQADILG